ncbi:DUF3899 domain-containing protein [Heyndrickxia coagulans]|uniref:DUF3899 domain-containing protein n=1 Tax=Heyndrickxia coagulans TaxID=1398 RepID=UPI002236966F|nr:DUF3899 domain-containing protein [Heyndrickxia coagulans]UZH06080.1 DUF3899 domain-containing protein [Heyndrickxia coagulans]
MKNVIANLVILLIWAAVKLYFEWDLLQMINYTFLIGISTLAIFTLLKILRTGFLDLFMSGFLQIGRALFPKSRSQERADRLIDNDPVIQNMKQILSHAVFKVSGFVSMTSLAISFISLAFWYWLT